uniref:Uncharacterized protein n=1 Tax=uncultured Armatimonadetes bacterium TaxID=157466 RepID=A0A6J4HZJ6_9BACT|nr:hypothetical protein AVDCRST_MAG63-1184 [uncultured Armatimonadetes bacterium]
MTTYTQRRRQRGATLIEVLTVVFILGLSTTVLLGLISTTARTADRRTLEDTMNARARTSVDEILLETRAAEQILASRVIGGTTYQTNDSDIVLLAPPFDPAQGIVTGTYDVIAFNFDPDARTVTETTQRQNPLSKRPSRTNHVIARQVESVRYTYRVRDQFTGDGTRNWFVLRTQAREARPSVFLNGSLVPPAEIGYSSATRTITLSSRSASSLDGQDVQVLYSVDPAANAAGLAKVNGVDVAVTLSEVDGRRIRRTFRLGGNARLRNQRT